jgi:hypothetical protein
MVPKRDEGSFFLQHFAVALLNDHLDFPSPIPFPLALCGRGRLDHPRLSICLYHFHTPLAGIAEAAAAGEIQN